MFMSLLRDYSLLLNDNFLAIDDVDTLAQAICVLCVFAYQLTVDIVDVAIYAGGIRLNEINASDVAVHALWIEIVK